MLGSEIIYLPRHLYLFHPPLPELNARPSLHPMPTLQSINLILVTLWIGSLIRAPVTTDLDTLVLHELYTTSDSVLIGDGTSLSIANIDSFTLTSLPTPLLFTNVLHVLVMFKSLISVSTLCADNPINILFFEYFF